jgi:uncharacterized membrane protein YjdF
MERKSSLWVWGLAVFFLLAVADGALRKWVMPSQSLVLFVLKDVVLAGSFALFALNRSPFQLPRPVQGTWLPLFLGLYIYVVVLQAFNFTQPNLAVRVLGIKAHLAYLPLLVLLPALLATLRRWTPEQLLLGYMGLVAVPVMLLGIYQFFQPPTAWINKYVADTEYISGVAGHPRITGTFSYIGGMTSFMLFNTLLGFGVLVGGLMTGRRRLTWGGAVFLGLALVVLPMSGSRGPVYFSGLLITGISALLLQRRGGGSSVFLALLLALGVAGGIATQTNVGEGWAALQERVETTSDEEKRIEGMLSGPIRGIEQAGLFGYGVGSLHQAALRLVPGSSTASDWVPAGYVENSIMRIIYELGALGWFVLLALKCTVAWMAYRALRRARSAFGFAVSILTLGQGVLHTVFPVVFNVTTGITYWAAVGLLLYVWSCQELRKERGKQRMQSAVVS